MLILTRKQGESITIGDDIKVTVLGVFGRQVRLGVDAPIKIVVHREEVYEKIKAKNERGADSDKVGDLGRLAGKTLSDFVGRVSRRRKRESQK